MKHWKEVYGMIFPYRIDVAILIKIGKFCNKLCCNAMFDYYKFIKHKDIIIIRKSVKNYNYKGDWWLANRVNYLDEGIIDGMHIQLSSGVYDKPNILEETTITQCKCSDKCQMNKYLVPKHQYIHNIIEKMASI